MGDRASISNTLSTSDRRRRPKSPPAPARARPPVRFNFKLQESAVEEATSHACPRGGPRKVGRGRRWERGQGRAGPADERAGDRA